MLLHGVVMGRPPRILTRELIASMSTPVTESGCWIWSGSPSDDGYGRIFINGERLRAHRASYSAHFGSIPEGLLVCHKCDTPLCVNQDHLFIGTPTDNIRDCAKKGRLAKQAYSRPNIFPRYRAGKKSKLSWKAVGEIKGLLASGVRPKDISALYQVTTQCINHIKCGRRRADL